MLIPIPVQLTPGGSMGLSRRGLPVMNFFIPGFRDTFLVEVQEYSAYGCPGPVRSGLVYVTLVNDIPLIIHNAFSPNGDLINDLWNIGNSDLYPEMEVTIYNRWGQSVWKSEKGYPDPWDGKSNGKPLPVDSYHYAIDLHNGSKIIIGAVTIVK